MIIATCQYQIEKLSNWDVYANKIENLVAQAKQAGAKLLLLPEYAGTEIVCNQFKTDQELFEALQPLLPKYLNFFQDLAEKHQIYIQAGTILQKLANDHFVNRAYLFGPRSYLGFQDKLQLTEFEKNLKILQRGNQQTLFVTELGKIGIAICYDSEFPEIVRRLVNRGATLILVPSYTSTMAGFHRISLSCRARAIENQCYVATSHVIESVDLSAAADETFGRAGIFGPADYLFPDDGIIAQGKLNEIHMITGEISVEKLAEVRKNGQVHNFEDRMFNYLIDEIPIVITE